MNDCKHIDLWDYLDGECADQSCKCKNCNCTHEEFAGIKYNLDDYKLPSKENSTLSSAYMLFEQAKNTIVDRMELSDNDSDKKQDLLGSTPAGRMAVLSAEFIGLANEIKLIDATGFPLASLLLISRYEELKKEFEVLQSELKSNLKNVDK